MSAPRSRPIRAPQTVTSRIVHALAALGVYTIVILVVASVWR